MSSLIYFIAQVFWPPQNVHICVMRLVTKTLIVIVVAKFVSVAQALEVRVAQLTYVVQQGVETMAHVQRHT